jgi:SAM-dependent methyltransferase
LDIGAGMGWSLDWLNHNYPHFERLAAIESSEHCINNLQDVVGASVISNDIDTDWKSTGFDLVIMRHVLEHFMNPVEALKKVEENLSENGIVYIAVPDMMNPKGSLNKYWFRTVHTFYFSEKTLDSIASMANLQLIEMKGENSELWGVFKKTNAPQKGRGGNVYEKQIRIIKKYQRKSILLDVKHLIFQIFSYLVPGRIRSWLKNHSWLG